MISIEKLDDARWYIWFVSGEMKGPPIPPYQLEIVMRDGRNFYVHSGNGRDENTNSICINVWDMRGLDLSSEAKIRELLSKPGVWEKVSSMQPYEINPLLSIGRLRCDIDEVLYVVEWWSRKWIIEDDKSNIQSNSTIGFPIPRREKNHLKNK